MSFHLRHFGIVFFVELEKFPLDGGPRHFPPGVNILLLVPSMAPISGHFPLLERLRAGFPPISLKSKNSLPSAPSFRETNKNYSSSQIEFLELLKKVFSRTKHIEIEDFAEPPLSNERPLDKFQVAELEKIVSKCGKIRMK